MNNRKENIMGAKINELATIKSPTPAEMVVVRGLRLVVVGLLLPRPDEPGSERRVETGDLTGWTPMT